MDVWQQIAELLPELRAYARSLADDPASAEDLVGDAIERAARSPSRPEETAALRPWMFRVIRNLNLDELRKLRVRRDYSAAHKRLYDETPEPRLGPDEGILIRRAFERLSAQQREVLFLVDIMGMRYAEAADVMEVPKGTVMSRLSRARAALLALVAPESERATKRSSKG